MRIEYRKLPHGSEMIGVLGLGMGGIQKSSDAEIEAVIRKLSVNAEACLRCGHCDERCPFGVAQSERMIKISALTLTVLSLTITVPSLKFTHSVQKNKTILIIVSVGIGNKAI